MLKKLIAFLLLYSSLLISMESGEVRDNNQNNNAVQAKTGQARLERKLKPTSPPPLKILALREALASSGMHYEFVSNSSTTVFLKPPPIDPASIVVKAACDRPRRTGKGINISLQFLGTKKVLHCYGHGGMGFTTLFGSIDEAVMLLMAENPDTQTPIRVIGSGCMGLTMALELYRIGFKNITISTKERFNIPSWRAGGFFDPGIGNQATLEDCRAVQRGLTTFFRLQDIERGEHPYLTKEIARRLFLYWPSTIKGGIELLEKLRLVPPSESVTIDFGNNSILHGYKRQLTYFINVTELMKQLWQQVKLSGIRVVQEEIKSFADCEESIICNCAGLGSRQLAADQLMEPVRGHFFMLPQTEDSLDYMFFLKTVISNRTEYIYFFPKPLFVDENGEEHESSGMLGGTYIPYSNLGPEALRLMDEEEWELLMQRTRKFFYHD